MKLPKNLFKQALKEKRPQIGLWVGLANAYSTEILAGAGFDWLVIDGEHAPNDIPLMLSQLQAMAAYPCQAIIRPPCADTVLIKQVLDIGAQTVLLPMIQNAQQAADVVSATRYPPKGIRGVGSAIARASRWNRIEDYIHHADEEICVIVQVESQEALNNLSDILTVDGVDGIFIGPADLCADMGFPGQPDHPKVREAIETAIQQIAKTEKAAGILMSSPVLAKHYLSLGALFVAVGVDTSLLAKSAESLVQQFKTENNHQCQEEKKQPSVY